ncbi:hypothetical protein PMAYCL1PPCAC_18919, partial [Pristionchus mayeri]
RFNAGFLSKLLVLLADYQVTRLVFTRVSCDEINDEDKKGFSDFVKKLHVKDMNIEFSPSMNVFLTEKFFADLSDSNLIELTSRTILEQTHLFRAHWSIIPALSRYTNLECSSIVLRADWAITLFIECLAVMERSSEYSRTWNVGLEGNLTDQLIESQLFGSGYTLCKDKIIE